MAVAGTIAWLPLLLVVHDCTGVLLALRIGSADTTLAESLEHVQRASAEILAAIMPRD
jgi:hypothetical protein